MSNFNRYKDVKTYKKNDNTQNVLKSSTTATKLRSKISGKCLHHYTTINTAQPSCDTNNHLFLQPYIFYKCPNNTGKKISFLCIFSLLPSQKSHCQPFLQRMLLCEYDVPKGPPGQQTSTTLHWFVPYHWLVRNIPEFSHRTVGLPNRRLKTTTSPAARKKTTSFFVKFNREPSNQQHTPTTM